VPRRACPAWRVRPQGGLSIRLHTVSKPQADSRGPARPRVACPGSSTPLSRRAFVTRDVPRRQVMALRLSTFDSLALPPLPTRDHWGFQWLERNLKAASNASVATTNIRSRGRPLWPSSHFRTTTILPLAVLSSIASWASRSASKRKVGPTFNRIAPRSTSVTYS